MQFLAVFRLVMASALLLATVGCATVHVESERTATRVTTHVQLTVDRFGICWPGDPDYRSAYLDPVTPPVPGQMVAGYVNHVRRGQSCHTQQSRAYIGVFYFDLLDIEHSVVTNAYLSLDIEDTNVANHVTHRYPSGTVEIRRDCALDLELATTDAFHGTASDPVSSTAIPSSTPSEVYLGVERSGITVTWPVQEWVLGHMPNLGFVVRPKPGAIDKNEDRCTGYLSNPRLSITVLRPGSD